MCERGDELDTTKAIIRALLIADKRPVTVRSFLIAFKDSEGLELPYAKFGFEDPLSFLCSIPDTAQLSQVGSDFYVKAVVTEEVEHVQRLVKGSRDSHYRSSRSPPAYKKTSRPAQTTLFTSPPRRLPPSPRYYDTLDQVKNNLRLLLADHMTNGINVRQLQDCYVKRFGCHINYASFGYSTFEDFLISMSDVMCAIRNSTGALKVFLSKRSFGVPLLPSGKPLPTFTVHHSAGKRPLPFQFPGQRILKPLQQLVRTANSWLPLHADMELRMLDSYQSKSTKQSFHQDIQPAGMASQTLNSYQSRSTFHQSTRPETMAPQMLESYQSRSSGQSLCSDMQPTGMEPQQLESFQSRPTERSLHRDIQPAGIPPQILESCRSRLTGHSFHPDIKPAVGKPPMPESCQTGHTKPSPRPGSLQARGRQRAHKSSRGRLSPVPELPLEYDESPTSPTVLDVDMLARQTRITRPSSERWEAVCIMNPRLETNIKKVLGQHPEGVWLSSFAKLYKEMTGVELCPTEYGYDNMMNLIADFRHVVSVSRPFSDGDFMICLHASPKEPTLDMKMVNVMQALIRMSGPQGLTLDELLQFYQGVTGESMNPAEHGFTRQTFVLFLTAQLNLTYECLGRGQFLLQSSWSSEQVASFKAEAAGSVKTAGATRTKATQATSTAWATDSAQVTDTAQETRRAPLTSTLWEMYGIDAYKNSEMAEYAETAESTDSDELDQIIMEALTSSKPTIGRVTSPPLIMSNNPYPQPDKLEVNKHYVVYVSQIYNAHHFYVQGKGTDASLRLEVLMNNLELVYNGLESIEYLIEDKLVYVGMPCAASYTYNEGNSDWHRALVVALDPDPSTCQVLLVDYGTLAVLPKNKLRFLRNDFFDLPPQAVRATMEYLKPATPEGWTLDAKAAFIQLVSDDKTVVCNVLKRRGPLHSVSLCITSCHPEAYVSDLLVEKGLALPTLRYKRIMAQLMEGEPFSTVLQEDDGIPNEPSSVNSGSDTTAQRPTAAEHPSHYPFLATQYLQGGLMPQPAHLIVTAHSSQPSDQAESCDRAQPGDQTIASDSQVINHAQALDQDCAHAPTIDQAEQMKGMPFAPLVQPRAPQPVACSIRRPIPHHPEDVPRKFVMPRQPTKNYMREMVAVCQRRGIAPPKDWKKLAEEEDIRLRRIHGPSFASSTVQPFTESTAQTTMQPSSQAASHSSGEPAAQSFKCPEPTVAASAVQPCPQSPVQDPAQSGGEPVVQPTASPAVQPSFEPFVQPTSGPAMLFHMTPPAHLYTLQEPQPSVEASVTSAPEAPLSQVPECSADEPHTTVEDEEDFMSVLRRELDGPCPARAVKPEYLKCGSCLVILNYEQVPYVTTANVCQLLGWTSDVILQKLETKRIRFPTLVLKKEDHGWLFNQMASYDVPGVKIRQHLAQQVTLFPLKNVVDLLNLFECTVKKLRQEVMAAVCAFDPTSPYWLCSSDDSDSDEGSTLDKQLTRLLNVSY
ncbi:uncharacterized protein [Dermacentor albipictus]|uniref:uncharacterized protein isoform X2 n=1 Tax=Dermacentor albipictus TaxID=60249 RepID=UPI0038FC5493